MAGQGLINRYAADLLNYANEHNRLESFFTCALTLLRGSAEFDVSHVPEKLDAYLRLIPPDKINAVLVKFADISREHLGLLDVTVYSAVPLDDGQLADIEEKLVRSLHKRINMNAEIDPSLLGGLRIIAGHIVIDNTIKMRLSEMKKNIYKGVYFK